MCSLKRCSTLILLVALLVSCTPATSPSPPDTPAWTSTQPAATALPHTPTLLPPTLTPQPTLSPTYTPTLPPTPTLSPLVVPFYHLRIEYATTSDWANFTFSNPEAILAMRLVSTPDAPTSTQFSAELVELFRPVDAIQTEPLVTMVFDLAIDPAAIQQPLELVSSHGGIGGSGLSIFAVNGEQTTLLQEINHYWQDPANPGRNDTHFKIALQGLSQFPLVQRQIPRSAPARLLWAVYYPWIAWDQSAACTDHPATPYAYSTGVIRTPETYAHQIELAQSAGIDGFFVSWLNDPNLNRNLTLLLEAAQARNFRIAIYLESTPDPNDRTVHPEAITSWLNYALTTFSSQPAYMQLNGKPLVMVYNSSAAPLETWQEIFTTVEAGGHSASYLGMSYNLGDLQLFDGLHQYAIIGMPNLAAVNLSMARGARNYPLLVTDASQKIFAATVQPGFDDCPYHPPDTTLFEDRRDGAYYRETFEAAIQSDPDWIIITSWNEYGETTHIEPSEFYGEQYLDITREYAQLWKDR